MNKKVMVAMSGGVDSSAAALLLLEQGYEIMGVTLKLFDNEDICETDKTKTCCSLSDVEDARAVSFKLGFPHYVFNFKQQFCENVIDRFVNSYINGETPNPCIDCNRYIKFDEMLNKAVGLENDYLATGHYAKVEFNKETGRYELKKAKDESKDQTYVLYNLTQYQLSKLLLPLGDLEKTEIRKIAESKGLVNARKPDSQDICFVRDGDYAGFIKDYTGKNLKSGNMVNEKGEVVGKHQGIEKYTIGQRKGLGVAFGQPQYVIKKDVENNTIVVGDEDRLFSNKLIAYDVNFISIETINEPMKVTAKTRYKQKEQPATISLIDNGEVLVEFETPQRAITPGQAVVFYNGDVVVGGGTIK